MEVSLRPMALFGRRCIRRRSVAAWIHLVSVCVFCCLPATSAVCAAAASSFSSSTDTATAEGLLFEDLLDVEPATAPLTVVLTSTGTQDVRLLRITYPPPSYIGRELSVSRIRFAGWCLPGSTLTVNGVPVPVFPKGGFAGISPLVLSSVTVLSFRAETPRGVAVHDVVLRRRQARPPDPPLAAGVIAVVHPDRELLLAPGDVARFSCRASSGARMAWVQLDRDAVRIPLRERAENQAGGTAVYTAEHLIGPDHPVIGSTRPVFVIQWNDGRVSSTTAGNLFGVLREPRTVVTTQDAWVFTEAAGERLHPYSVPGGVALSLTGVQGGMCRVSPDMMRTFYIARDRIRFTPEVVQLPRRRLRSAVIQRESQDHLAVSFSVSALPMYIAELHEDLDFLRITFFNTALDTGWTSSPSSVESFGSIEYRETGDGTLVCTVRPVRGRSVWGYDVRAGNGTFTVRLTLDPPRRRNLRGVRIFVDPGHGGADDGAIGPVGLREKDVNLAICRELASLLARAGATVVESRTGDTALTWQERFARARDVHPHLYLCMHNNSVPDASDPLAVRGVSVFYQSPRGKRLAEHIVREHTALGIPEAYLVWRTPYRGLPHGPVFVVVESAFLSHPADEEVLSDRRMLRRIARGVARAVRRFIAEERRRPSR